MHLEVLSKKQKEFLPLLKKFEGFYLAGGTALALQIGHRRSNDFDLFTSGKLNSERLLKILKKYDIESTIVNTEEELTLIVGSIRLTFLKYPFNIPTHLISGLMMPKPWIIGAMKAYTLGRRAKWKDYVDMYFLCQKYGLEKIVNSAVEIFRETFSRKNFYEQLCYFKDIDFSEKVDLVGKKVSDKEIKKYLCDAAIC